MLENTEGGHGPPADAHGYVPDVNDWPHFWAKRNLHFIFSAPPHPHCPKHLNIAQSTLSHDRRIKMENKKSWTFFMRYA